MKLISLISIVIFSTVDAQSFSIARVHYGGGGDWYSDPSSIPNLLTYLEENTPMSTVSEDTLDIAPLNQIKVISYKEKNNWVLETKYNIGKKRSPEPQ